MARRNPPRKVTYFEPVPPRLPRNTVIGSTFEVGRHFRCTMRVDCGELDPGAVIRPAPGGWHPRIPEPLDDAELADWRVGREHFAKIPIACALDRGFVQPGFNEIAPLRPSSATLLARPHRNLLIST
jgi:hypothetical protein